MSTMGAPAVARLGDRSLFSTLEPFAYLNHAAISALSDPVVSSVIEATEDYARRGLDAWGRWNDVRVTLRMRLADLIGAEGPDTIGLVPNTTHGVLSVALCYPWRAGDGVVSFVGEFPANVTPWQRAAELFDLRMQLLPMAAACDDLGQLEATLASGDVRVVAVSAVQFQTGLRLPLAELAALAHRYGAELFVDAIQAVGVVPVDVVSAGIDYLVAGSHKWLGAPEGAAFLYVASRHAERLVPRVAGWVSHSEALRFLFEGPGQLRYDRGFQRAPAFLEVGAPNTLAHVGLETSVRLLASLSVEAIYTHVNRYLDALEPLVVRRGFASERRPLSAQRSGILSCTVPEGVDLATLASDLRALGVSVTTPDGRLRFAPHWPNALDEVPRVADALDEAIDLALEKAVRLSRSR